MNWLGVGVLGGVAGLDATSFAQVMLSRPLVAGILTGLLFGHPREGAMIGAVLEIFDLGILPVGATRYPDAGTATVAAVAAYSTVPLHALDPGVLLLAVLFGLAWESVTGTSTVLLRRVNERLVLGTPRWRGNPGRTLERQHLLSMVLDFLRAAALAVTGAAVGGVLLRLAAGRWVLGAEIATAGLTVAAAAMAGALLGVFGGWRERRRALGIGVLGGSLLLLLLR
ncbi:MAG TPA: PTS sugar transporter subunit IIC [Longimicrobiales bacterium]|nr:PTS sugar transporter subunit IIC [Longimicrobiales bacterium]